MPINMEVGTKTLKWTVLFEKPTILWDKRWKLSLSDVTFAPTSGDQYQEVGSDVNLACSVTNLDYGQVTSHSYTWPSSCSSCQASSTSTYTIEV